MYVYFNASLSGVVVGALTPSGAIDELTVRRLRDAAGDMQLTFHRAIDVSSESIDEAVTKLARLGCDRILSSGMRRTAADGLEALAAMVRLVQERHYRIRVVAASGVNAGNACNIIASAGVHGVHAGSAVSLPRRNPSWWQWHFPSAPAVSMGTGGTETSDMEFPLVDESLVRAFVQSAMNR
jgi:copper homeostasis protein